jgi:hypothetical protein
MNTKQPEKKWYVYLLCDPDTEKPFYVGKGTGKRMYEHESHVDFLLDGNAAKKLIIQRIFAQGKKVLKKKIAEFDDEQDALVYEWAMISLYGESLTNIQHRGGKSSHEEMDKSHTKPLVVPRRRAKEMLGWPTNVQFRRLCQNGTLSAIQVGERRTVFLVKELENYIRSLRKEAS